MKTYERKSDLLYLSKVEYADYCINVADGCAHGCKYPCYAQMIRRKSYDDWIDPKLVSNALEKLDKELPKKASKIDNVHLCFSTDPFMVGYPEVEDLTLKIIERLHGAGVKCQTLTKGITPGVLIHIDKYGSDNFYGATVTGFADEYVKRWEPHSAPPETRLAALELLHDAGLKTWVSMEPYPTSNIVEQELEDILNAVSFVDRIIFGKWNYNRQIPKDVAGFYRGCVGLVREYCKEAGIDVHIKEGT